jgi:hypothetical protein
MIATIRVGSIGATEELLRVVRSGVDLSQIAAHVRNECRANAAVEKAYNEIDFTINGPAELPGLTQMQALLGVASRTSDAGSERSKSTEITVQRSMYRRSA